MAWPCSWSSRTSCRPSPSRRARTSSSRAASSPRGRRPTSPRTRGSARPIWAGSKAVSARAGASCPGMGGWSSMASVARAGSASPTARKGRKRNMALIKVTDLAYGRLRAPDLDTAEEFLTHFGMVRSARTPTALYMRGTDAPHHLHVTEKGDPGFVGLAYYAASLDDLKKVAKAPGASGIESIDEPGGGKRVRLKEPNGYQVEVVYGIKPLKPIKVPRQPLNLGAEGLKRAGKVLRIHR